jgi:hypothetical protein
VDLAAWIECVMNEWEARFLRAMRDCHPEPWLVADCVQLPGWRSTLCASWPRWLLERKDEY